MKSTFLSSASLFLATGAIATPSAKRQATGGFCNAVFNTGAPANPGWPNAIWDSLTSNGVSGFIAFCLSPLDSCSTYNYNTAPLPDAMKAAQIPICMDPSKISQAGVNCLNELSSDSTPTFMEVFNEPDYSYENATPLTSAQDAAAAAEQLISAAGNKQLISPAPAFTGSDYLTDFFGNCTECDSKFNIIAAHVYSPDPNAAVKQITDLHDKWPTKDIWVTEISPASGTGQGCELDENGVVGWMQTVLGQVKALGYVKKVFWNSGEHGALDPANPDVCNPSLTNPDGSPTAVLQAYKQFC